MMTIRWFSTRCPSRPAYTRRRPSSPRTFAAIGLEQLEQRTCMANDLDVQAPIYLAFATPVNYEAALIDQRRVVVRNDDCLLDTNYPVLVISSEECLDPSVGPRPAPVTRVALGLLSAFEFATSKSNTHAQYFSGARDASEPANSAISNWSSGGTEQLSIVFDQADEDSRPDVLKITQMQVSETQQEAATDPTATAANESPASAQPVSVAEKHRAAPARPHEKSTRSVSLVSTIDWTITKDKAAEDSPAGVDCCERVETTALDATELAKPDQENASSQAERFDWTGLLPYRAPVHQDFVSDARPHLAATPDMRLKHGDDTTIAERTELPDTHVDTRLELESVEVVASIHALWPSSRPADQSQERETLDDQAGDPAARVMLDNQADSSIASRERRSRLWYLAMIPAFFAFARKPKRANLLVP